VNVAYKGSQKLEWVVRENPELQAELNQLPEPVEEVSSRVVSKVVARIKDL
jgi:hypothetical protein